MYPRATIQDNHNGGLVGAAAPGAPAHAPAASKKSEKNLQEASRGSIIANFLHMCHVPVCVWEATYRVPCLLAARVFFLLFLALSLSVCRRSPLFSFRSCLSAFSAASRPSRHASRSMRCLLCVHHTRRAPTPTRAHPPSPHQAPHSTQEH